MSSDRIRPQQKGNTVRIDSQDLTIPQRRSAPHRFRRLAVLVCLAIPAFCVTATDAHVQEASIAVPWEPIPLAGFRSWSLFLVCDEGWARPQAAPQLKELYNQFQLFGKAIGPSHVAVWLAATRSAPTRIDSARSTRFCEQLKLPQSEGPYVMLTTDYPGRANPDDPASFNSNLPNYLVLSLNGISATQTTHLLDILAKELVREELDDLDVQSQQFWTVLQNAFAAPGDTVLSKVSATFHTRFFSTAIAQPARALVGSPATSGPDISIGPAIPSGTTWVAENNTGSSVRLTAFVKAGSGLQYEASRNGYAGFFSVALQNLDRQTDRIELKNPVTVAVQASGASEFKPFPVKMTRLLEWMDVALLVLDPREPMYLVSVSAQPEDPGNTVQLQVIRPRVGLSAAASSILGWGLGTTRIHVTAPAYAGKTLHLTAHGGALDDSSVPLDGLGNGVTVLRSDSSPTATIQIESMRGDSEPLTINFRQPYLFLAAAMLGGLLGAFLRGKGRKRWQKALAIGVASAVLITVGYAIGFTSWTSSVLGSDALATSGEAVVFFVGAIAALIGVSFIIPNPRSHEG